MARDYDVIHCIQDQMTSLNPQLTSAVVRMHNRITERQLYASALSTSVTLFLAMKCLKLSPKLILGTIQYQGLSYPHAWIELDDKIFDLATHQDIKCHPVLKDRELESVSPMINIGYEEASATIRYYPFQFGGTWELANIYKAVGKTLEKYMDESLYIDILADACYILELPETPENLDMLREIAKLETIRDKDESGEKKESVNSEKTLESSTNSQSFSKSFTDGVESVTSVLKNGWNKVRSVLAGKTD